MADSSAAVALFVFNRPQPTAQVYERIRAARPRRLLVVADGARASRPEDIELCRITRKVVSSPDWPCELLTNFSDENLGCRQRVSSGLDWIFQECEEAIVLEDDCVPSLSFFRFCGELLSRYRDDPRIMHISGDNFQDGSRRGEASYFCSRYTHSWGWATWRRAWCHYDSGMSWWPTARKQRWLEDILDDPGEAKYWDGIFQRLYLGQIDTWDYQWLFACWRQGGLSILPNVNLVTNIGIGADATHFKEADGTVGIAAHELESLVHPGQVVRDLEADRYTFRTHIRGNSEPGDRTWLREVRHRLALGARMKRMVFGSPDSL